MIFSLKSKLVSARKLMLVFSCTFALLNSNSSFSHGGVAFEEDLCVITINFMQAHFTVFQPEVSQNEEFCEDIPNATTSVFVMEYLQDFSEFHFQVNLHMKYLFKRGMVIL